VGGDGKDMKTVWNDIKPGIISLAIILGAAALLLTACATPTPTPVIGPSTRTIPEADRYMQQVRKQIEKVWPDPCAKVTESNCEYKSAEVDLEIGLRESGELQYVKIVRSSGIELYDSYAVNAVRLAAPYPPVPVSMLARRERESEAISTTGLRAGVSKPGAWINARFTYGPQGRVAPGAGR
jgi:TonB family protein